MASERENEIKEYAKSVVEFTIPEIVDHLYPDAKYYDRTMILRGYYRSIRRMEKWGEAERIGKYVEPTTHNESIIWRLTV